MLSYQDSAFMAETCVSLGAAADIDIIVCRCRAALAWDRHGASSFGADPERIFVVGSSAGGHLIAMRVVGGWHEAPVRRLRCPDDPP